MDLDLRLVRAFVAVAEERHFGRAAERLYVAQPALSRQVRRLERQLGSRLLDRTSRSVALTEAGHRFLVDSKALLAAADVAVSKVSGDPTLTVGFMAGLSPGPAVLDLRARHPDVRVHLRWVDWSDQARWLLEGHGDVLLGRSPIQGAGLQVERLYDEPRVLLLPADHRLADKDRVSILDVAGEPMVRHAGPAAGEWDAYWAVDPRPDGSRAVWGPVVTRPEEKLEHVASGQGLTVLPASTAEILVRPDVRAVPLVDVSPATVVLAWPAAGVSSPLTREFVDLARRLVAPPGGSEQDPVSP